MKVELKEVILAKCRLGDWKTSNSLARSKYRQTLMSSDGG